MKCKYLLCIAFLLWGGVVQAAAEPCSGTAYRAFDFWLGEWRVTDAEGNFAGTNQISVEHGGCLVLEAWQGARGGRGTSLNFYDADAGQWRQIWVSRGVIIELAGGLENGAMVLTGSIDYIGRETFDFRGTWTPRADGSVRQFFEEARTPGQWQPWFEGIYRPVAGPP